MTRLEVSVMIKRSAKDIFAFLNTPENHPKFVPGMLEFNKTSPGPLGQVGATAQGVRKFLGRRMELPYEIIEVEPNSKFGMKGVIGPITFKDGYVLDPIGNSTRVKFWLEPVLSGLIKFANPLVALVGKIHANETLANLKKAVETTP